MSRQSQPLSGKGKAIVVVSSRLEAVAGQLAIDKDIKEKDSPHA